jgi:hypothetical protein
MMMMMMMMMMNDDDDRWLLLHICITYKLDRDKSITYQCLL